MRQGLRAWCEGLGARGGGEAGVVGVGVLKGRVLELWLRRPGVDRPRWRGAVLFYRRAW